MDSLVAKTRAWEQDRDTTFTYDGVPLLAMLDEYMMLRHDREEEKRRLRVSPEPLVKLIRGKKELNLSISLCLMSHQE